MRKHLGKIAVVVILIGLIAYQFMQGDSYKNNIVSFYKLGSADSLQIIDMPSYQQTEDYTCGPALVMSLLKFYGKLSDKDMNKETELRIATEMGTTSEVGTSPKQMADWLEKNGFQVVVGENGTIDMLKQNAAKNIPTIVEWIDWGGHWVAVNGFYKDELVFMSDPAASVNYAPNLYNLTAFGADRFKSMWFDAQYIRPGEVVHGVYLVALPK